MLRTIARARRIHIEPGARLLILSSFFSSIPIGFLTVALPIYLDRVGLHPELIGTLFTVSGLVSSVLLVVFGLLADRYGRKPFVILGSSMPLVSYLILAFTTSRPLLLIASAVGGIGLAGGMSGALMNAGFNALLSENSTPETRTSIFSFAEMAWVGAALIGSLLAGLPLLVQQVVGLSYTGSYHIAFLLMAGLGVAGTLVLFPLRERHTRSDARPHWLPRASGKRIALLSLTLGTLGLGLGFIVQLLPLWFHLQYRVSEAFLGPWYGLAQVGALVGLMAAPPLTRRWGAVPYVVVAQGSASAFLIAMAFAPTATVAAILYIVRSITMNSSWPVQQAYIMDIVEPADRSSASSITYAAWSVASALTPPAGGALLAARLYRLPFLLGAICYLASISTFFGFFRHVRATGAPSHTATAPQAIGD